MTPEKIQEVAALYRAKLAEYVVGPKVYPHEDLLRTDADGFWAPKYPKV